MNKLGFLHKWINHFIHNNPILVSKYTFEKKRKIDKKKRQYDP